MDKKIKVLGTFVSLDYEQKKDYLSLTDIARYKNAAEPKDIVKNWLCNKNTLKFLGLWEKINNINFKGVEFDSSAKEWREKNPLLEGNIRDYSDVTQLVCLSNLENLNAHFIKEGIDKVKRLEKLNEIAIEQMTILTSDHEIKKLG